MPKIDSLWWYDLLRLAALVSFIAFIAFICWSEATFDARMAAARAEGERRADIAWAAELAARAAQTNAAVVVESEIVRK